jgi:hypothetical protein
VYATVQIPVFALWSARSLEKQGQLVEAAERYLEATRLADGEGEPGAQERARGEADQERQALLPRVPQLVIQVSPEGTEGLKVSVNGDDYAVSLLGAKRPTNPGTVTVLAERGAARREATVTLVEGATLDVVLDLTEAAPAGAGAVSATSSSTGAKEGGSALRPTFIYGGFSLAALGAGTGIATGMMAMSQAKAVKADYACDAEGVCDEGGQDAQKKATTLGTISTVGFGVAALGVAFGVWGLLMDEPEESVAAKEPGIRVTFDVGSTNSVLVGGSF